MLNPDLFRTILISLAALLVGVVLFGAYAAWRDRYLPVPRRAPIVTVLLFIAGYVLLLAQLVMERWMNLGEQIGPAAWTALTAVTLNVIAMMMLVRSAQPGPALAERHAQFRRTVQLFRESLSLLDVLNQMNWEEHHNGAALPHTRYADRLIHLSDEELERLLEQVQKKRVKVH
jgi:hypothetical protein